MDNTAVKPDMVDANDSFEAIGVFKCMKNLFCFVCIVCLLLLQSVFWLNHCGYIDDKVDTEAVQTPDSSPAVVVEKTDEQAEIEKLAEIATEKTSGEPEAEVSKSKKELAKEMLSLAIPDRGQSIVLIKACNFIVVISACMYTLALLMSVKISLAGRLGGITHISRGFFRSLLAFVVILPWQECFDTVVYGAIYTPGELFDGCVLSEVPGLAEQISYYFRFSGLWVIVVVLLVLAQMSTKRWYQLVTKRLGHHYA